MFSPQVRKTADGGMFPIEASPFVKEIPPELVCTKRISTGYGNAGGYGSAGYGSGSYGSGHYGSGSYGSGHGAGRTGGGYGSQKKPQTITRTTWRH